jgi:hypothetical protein
VAFGVPHQEVLRSMRLFASEVMPHFRRQAALAAAKN